MAYGTELFLCQKVIQQGLDGLSFLHDVRGIGANEPQEIASKPFKSPAYKGKCIQMCIRRKNTKAARLDEYSKEVRYAFEQVAEGFGPDGKEHPILNGDYFVLFRYSKFRKQGSDPCRQGNTDRRPRGLQ